MALKRSPPTPTMSAATPTYQASPIFNGASRPFLPSSGIAIAWPAMGACGRWNSIHWATIPSTEPASAKAHKMRLAQFALWSVMIPSLTAPQRPQSYRSAAWRLTGSERYRTEPAPVHLSPYRSSAVPFPGTATCQVWMPSTRGRGDVAKPKSDIHVSPMRTSTAAASRLALVSVTRHR